MCLQRLPRTIQDVTLTIYGAGMAGLLTAQMLRRARPVVSERQPELPDNHGALLRFRSDAVARETGQTFRRVRVLKAVKSGGRLHMSPTMQDANLYAYKVTGSIEPRSILDVAPCERFIAPADFLGSLARDADITYGRELLPVDLQAAKHEPDNVIISTIPMPTLMEIAGWPDKPEFTYRAVWSVTVHIENPPVDVYQTIYYPEPDVPYYRASLTGSRLIMEFFRDPAPEDDRSMVSISTGQVLRDFGLPTDLRASYGLPKHQRFGKLMPMDDRKRQEFILAMSDEFNVYSVGRFATWRQILLDDVVSDVRTVEKMITQRSTYQRRLSSAKR